MKKLLTIVLLMIGSCCLAQNRPDYENIKLVKPEEIRAADTFALVDASHLLSTPNDKNSLHRLEALQFIIKWMEVTPDYNFTLEEVTTKFMKGNTDLLGLYMAAMTKYVLENKASSKNEKLIRLNAITMLLNYCENENNNIKMTKQLKKLSEAKAAGKLEEALQ
jgi:hypothetical protein